MLRMSRSRFKPLAALSALFRPPAATPEPPPEAGLFTVHRSTLPNGLRVWVKPRFGTGAVFLALQVPVGSRHETKADNGISHFLEHMLFTGTRKWNEQEVVEIIRRRGGESNARTAPEDTVFWLKLQAADLALGVEWLSEIVFHPLLLEDKFEKERHVIIQEKGGEFGVLEDLGKWIEERGLGWNVFYAVQRQLFPQTSLLLPVIGEEASLRGITHAQLVEFYQRHYLPNNATLIVVGDAHPETVLELARAHLGELPPGERPPRPATPPSLEQGFRLRLHGPNLNEQGQILLGAPLPGLNHPDRWALGVLAELLDTRLTQDIRFKRGLVYGIDVYPALYTDVGQFVVYTTADSQKFGEILTEVENQIEVAIRGELDAAAVAEAKAAIRGRLLLGIESNPDLGWWLAEMSLFTSEEAPLPDLFANVEAVTPDDVARVARLYLSPEKRYQAVHRPSLTPNSLVRPALLSLGLALTGLGVWLLARARDKNQANKRAV